MPIYEYECTSCHHQFELMQKVNDPPAKQCPKCLANSVTKLVSAAGFQLKGDGWYVTDFRDKGKKKEKENASTNHDAKKKDNSSTQNKNSSASDKTKGTKD